MLLVAAILLVLASTLASTAWLVLSMAHVVASSIVIVLSVGVCPTTIASPLVIGIFATWPPIGVAVRTRVAISIVAVSLLVLLASPVFVVLAVVVVVTAGIALAFFVVPGMVVARGTSIFVVVVA